MNVPVRQPVAAQRLKVVDCDIHPAYATPTALFEFLSQRWRDHWSTFGAFFRPPLIGQLPFPRMMAGGMRIDSFPKNGSPPGADLELMQRQHLDANGVEVGMLIALSRGGMEERNLDFAAALSTAANDWQLHKWCEPEPRLRAAIVVPQEHTEHAVAEIERRSSDPAFVQILMSPRTADPLGNRRYWPIYEAAQAHNKPVALHVAGFSGGHSSTPHRLAHLLHAGALRPGHRHAEHAVEPGVRGRVRALPQAQGGADRGRLCLGAGARLAHGQGLGAHARRGAASEAAAVGVRARARLVHHPADRRAGASRSISSTS